MSRLAEIESCFSKELGECQNLDSLQEFWGKYLGKKGELAVQFETLKSLPKEEKQTFGQELNHLKNRLHEQFENQKSKIENAALEAELLRSGLDPSLAARQPLLGRKHPLTLVMEEVCRTFCEMGFQIAEGPEVELDTLNFDALNIPADHPARDMHDTFYVRDEHLRLREESSKRLGKLLLRTHTSPVQIRVMRDSQPPVRIIAPGRVFRHEAVDATHSSVFHQVEGLTIGSRISFSDLKGTLEHFVKRFFGAMVDIRFRPSFFPFVEPGVEVDLTCTVCAPKTRNSCPVCKSTGWIEMLGAGMVHPNVLRAGGMDPDQVTGYAFGMGIERIAMVRYGVKDMRLFYENHLDFLSQLK